MHRSDDRCWRWKIKLVVTINETCILTQSSLYSPCTEVPTNQQVRIYLSDNITCWIFISLQTLTTRYVIVFWFLSPSQPNFYNRILILSQPLSKQSGSTGKLERWSRWHSEFRTAAKLISGPDFQDQHEVFLHLTLKTDLWVAVRLAKNLAGIGQIPNLSG